MSRRITSEELAQLQGGKPAKGRKKNKYNVAPPEARTWRDFTYASKAEMIYAQSLDLLQTNGDILGYCEHPRVMLGEDTRFKPDFLVIEPRQSYYVDVKGRETREWLKVKKLWAKYQNVPLHVIVFNYAKGTFETVEIIGGAA